jgi:NTE family protein
LQISCPRPLEISRLAVLILASAWLLLDTPATAFAQSLAGDSPATERPRIGLVLGGGGAKGAAHIGVLRVLDELRVPVDCVTGTSMGALVGATLAAGMPPEEIERRVRAINWSATVGTEGLRDRTPINRKLAGITYTNSLDLGIKDGQVRAPGGFLKTQDIEDVLRDLVAEARLTDDFDELPLPFRAAATDMVNGELVVLESGDLAVAMRASMAVPGAFAPILVDDRVLSDGGMMRNLPVDIARGLCADVVIAVSLASPPPKAADLTSALALAGRSLDVMIDANQKAQLATLTERDVSIIVPMGDIGSASFERVPDAIPLGAEAARAQAAALSRYSLPDEEYFAWRRKVDRARFEPVRLADVRVTGLERVNPEYIHAQIRNAVPGARVTPAAIADDTRRLYALGDFEKVEYSLSGDPAAPTLEINAVEKSWGPDFVRFDLGLVASFGGDLLFALRGEHNRTWINSRGAEWRNALQIGQEAIVETAFYQPLDVRQRFFIEPRVLATQTLEDVFLDGDRVARYEVTEGYGQLDLGVNVATRAQLRAGLRRGWADAEVDIGFGLPNIDTADVTEMVLGATYDTRDSVGLPTRGALLNARYVMAGTSLGGDVSYDVVEGMALKALSFRGNTLQLLVAGGDDLGDDDLPPWRDFQLGGIRSFPGLQRGELRGESYWTAGANYFWKLADIQSLFGQAIYAGLRLNAGRMGERIDGIRDGTIYGASVNFGGRTPLGPFLVSLGEADGDSWELQFSLGRPIFEGSILDETR